MYAYAHIRLLEPDPARAQHTETKKRAKAGEISE
jgi:hypothetical protein